MYKYFEIPFENVPATPTYTVWYASWSKERPMLEPGMLPPVVIGMTTEDLPPKATLLAAARDVKNPPPPPPPLAVAGMDEFRQAFGIWLNSIMGD